MYEKSLFSDDFDSESPTDISRIVRAVESLPGEDKARVMRLIELMAAIPEANQRSSVRQVLQLLSGFRLLSKQECRFRVDTAIARLEAECGGEYAIGGQDMH